MLALLAALPDAYWDAFLLQRFPGKTLEELDCLDWGRLLRALHVREVDRIEDLRTTYLAGKAKPTADEWRAVLRHDRLAEQEENANE